MGTDYPSYLKEARRVLKPRFAPSANCNLLDHLVSIIFVRCPTHVYFCSGWLLIAEVKSRFDPNTGGADPNKFLKAVSELGFTSILKVY